MKIQTDRIRMSASYQPENLIHFCHNSSGQYAELISLPVFEYNLRKQQCAVFYIIWIGLSWVKQYWIIFHRCTFRQK